ncbi:probable serine/threonine-protein kinase cdc7 isoform X1 [Contarinia nasturtii]|uniref:probable serine/threonine-protein kinase cdc7 isoform X1 n=1 Tax=Contarinia nasturtii TaxID=265458 RepID=UPI0012D3ADCA|nr:probable serine/threonine-protein kinase cdc7 isoform X1 [Contarinia nasturtii]XP_031630882.1 probable serine/threonine-protein kinase cdc7 isoform X1 [Contarinia nasturtii]
MTRMTGSRFARTGRCRLFIALGAFVLMVTMVFVKLQLDEARKMEVRCEYQQDALNLQLTDLQKKLRVERLQYEQSEQQSQKQYELKERTVQESNTKLNSLQQHYKLLKNQYDDFKDECTKEKSEKIDKIKSLQNKLEENSCKEKDKDIEIWKTKYFELLNAKHMESVNNFDHDWRSSSRSTKEAVVEKNFNAQIAVNNKLYSIPIKYNNNTKSKDEKVENTTSILKTSESLVNNSITSSKIISFNKSSKSKTIRNEHQMKFPNGVVPIPFEQPNIEQIIHSSEKVQAIQKNSKNEDLGAREENDSNYEEQNDHMAKALSHTNDLIGDDNNKSNNKFNAIDIPNVNNEDLQVIQQPNDILANENKLKNEVNEDQGKAYVDEMNFQVEDEDDDEYTDHRHQGQAVRERR